MYLDPCFEGPLKSNHVHLQENEIECHICFFVKWICTCGFFIVIVLYIHELKYMHVKLSPLSPSICGYCWISPSFLSIINNLSTCHNEQRHKKTCIRGSHHVRHKPGCKTTEDGLKLLISYLGSRGIVLFIYVAKTKSLISYRTVR